MLSLVAQATSSSILDALLAHDLPRADAEVRTIVKAHGLAGAYRALRDILYEVGAQWEAGTTTVAQEHYCTAAVQRIMVRLHGEVFQTVPSGRSLLAASVGGNQHSVGIRMIADLFELQGWSTMCLGADNPSDTIVATVAQTRFDVLAISAALETHLPEVATLIRCARAADPRIRVLVGGLAFASTPGLWQRLGADGYAHDPEAAVAEAERLLEQIVVDPARRMLSLVREARAPGDERTFSALSAVNTDLYDTARALAARNAELGQINAQLNRVMGVMAHDLRNPISVIGHYVEFLREDLEAALGPEQREMLDALEQSSLYMKKLVDDALDVSRIGAGKLVLEVQPVELVAYVRGLIGLNAPLAARKHIELVFETAVEELVVPIDCQRMQQVINNLVSNAIQYSHPHTSVTIAIGVAAGSVALEVRDRGQGIAAQELPKVFGAFETTRTRGTQGEKSTGLGLAIVKSIVDAHRGRVSVDSELGTGSTFTVTLPIA
jgi:signal transduction histidine kinase